MFNMFVDDAQTGQNLITLHVAESAVIPLADLLSDHGYLVSYDYWGR